MRLLSITWVRELEAYSREAVLGIFGLAGAEQEERDAFLLQLMGRRILKKRTAARAGEEDDPLEHFTGNGDYAFSYVGLYCYEGHLVYSLPKYERQYNLTKPERQAPETQPDDGRMETFALLMRVIRRYNASKISEALENELQEQSSDCYLAQLVSMVTDYAEHGEYRDDEQRIALNEQGRILWNRTINCTTPFMQDDEPVYLDTYTSRLVDAEDHFITRLHRVVVKECCRQLQMFGLVELLELPMVDAIEEDAEELGDTEYLLHCVENELGCQFDSRRRHILHRLKAYLEGEKQRDDDAPEDYFFGCTSFHCVWENVCACTLGMDVKEHYRIKPPEWHLDGPGKATASHLKPDMVFERNGAVYVLDAKYYLPELKKAEDKNGKARVSGLPGVGDVTKQFLYRKAIMKSNALESDAAQTCAKKVYNAFLMPQDTSLESPKPVEHYAHVTMALFKDEGRIDTYRLAVTLLYSAYVEGSICMDVASELHEMLYKAQSKKVKIFNFTPASLPVIAEFSSGQFLLESPL